MKTSQYQIIDSLFHAQGPLTMEELSGMTGLKTRSLRYDLAQIEDILSGCRITLVRKPGTGIWLEYGSGVDKESLLAQFKKETLKDSADPRIRQSYILQRLLSARRPLHSHELEEELGISHNTFTRDLQKAKEWLQSQGIEVLTSRKGIALSCGESTLRKAFTAFYQTYYKDDLFRYLETSDSLIPGFEEQDRQDARWIRSLIDRTEKESGEIYAENSKVALTWHILLAVKRLQAGRVIQIDPGQLEELKKEPEYQTAGHLAQEVGNHYSLDIPQSEVGYITLHLVGMGRRKNDRGASHLYIQRDEIIEFLDRIGILLQCGLSCDEELINNLMIHLEPAIARARHDIRLENPLLSQIQSDYPRIYDAVGKAVVFLEERKGIRFSADELGYITLYIASVLTPSSPSSSRPVHVLLVCGTGMATARMLEARVREAFPHFIIEGTASSLNERQLDRRDIDLILTTIPIRSAAASRILQVSPLLNKEDIALIEQASHTRAASARNLSVKELMPLIEKFADVHDKDALEASLNQMLGGESGGEMLRGLLSESRIRIEEKPLTWHQALRESNSLLKKEGYTEEEYADRIIEMADKYSNYFIIADGVAIAHAPNDETVHQTGFSLLVLPGGVQADEKNTVRWLFTLASVSDRIHEQALQELLEMIRSGDFHAPAHSIEEVKELFRRKSA